MGRTKTNWLYRVCKRLSVSHLIKASFVPLAREHESKAAGKSGFDLYNDVFVIMPATSPRYKYEHLAAID